MSADDPSPRHGGPPTLLRLSVGIESVEDLWADLDRALLGPVGGK